MEQEVIQYIAVALQATNQEDLQNKLQQIAPTPESQQELLQVAAQSLQQGVSPEEFGGMLMNQVQMAKKGGYLKYLKGGCPEGYEKSEQGGVLRCKKCKGGKIK